MLYAGIAFILIGVCYWDGYSCYLNIQRRRNCGGPSGIPLIGFAFDIIGVIFLFFVFDWWICLVLLGCLFCLHLFLQSIMPHLYASFFNGSQPIHIAVIFRREKKFWQLIEDGADVNAQCNLGMTPLHIAVGKGDIKFVRLLLENGADRHIEECEGNSSVDYAFMYSPELVELLTEEHNTENRD